MATASSSVIFQGSFMLLQLGLLWYFFPVRDTHTI